MTTNIVISHPLRTAIGSFGGTVKDLSASDLGVIVLKSIISHSKIDPLEISDCILGNVLQAGQGMNPARQVVLKSGLPVTIPAITINRVCASGLQSIISAAQSIKSGDGKVIIAGGIENMDMAPYYLKKARYGYRLSLPSEEMIDGMVYDGLWDIFNNVHMGLTAEYISEKYSISREEQDNFAYNSHLKALKAISEGRFIAQITPIELPSKKEVILFKEDEYPRKDTTLDKLSTLKPVFKKDGTVTAGNSSGINDGAALMLISSEDTAERLGLKVMGRLVSYALAGLEPNLMGMGPVPAIISALEKARLTLNDIDLFEINEAFAAQALGVIKELQIPEEKNNVNGGAIALGHPIGSSGAILMVKLLHEMERQQKKLGLVSLCVGGGMGIAAIVSR
ncbi:MAG: Acetyl-CoA acetyltransferase [candidate division WS2 bacterium]|uniref:acetyl-CoA C-acetyltransferase n=1 Tax=Psychracetigena formicireducens TaxID=2986056 RepID=A0A9E2F4V7_PSYF1|nr:Acetyl-CoA acetyltransferase [Candidatus Psychracetigena formicireducens]MBT9145496.1 Acetyl-CoA acetyltransferase [Candidatus Psychracetigena formicireducens]MBT9150803.1 Acetyl-CoA acetyltransferase [Candidatus Psychracetigena formicireducens]